MVTNTQHLKTKAAQDAAEALAALLPEGCTLAILECTTDTLSAVMLTAGGCVTATLPAGLPGETELSAAMKALPALHRAWNPRTYKIDTKRVSSAKKETNE